MSNGEKIYAYFHVDTTNTLTVVSNGLPRAIHSAPFVEIKHLRERDL